MLLKKIEIYGFKSFADRIHIKFDKGITAIVGPNGSGKSNVGDAVRWVLGEQSAKSLRGSKMEDIIFSGTQIRKALGFAEVALTFDNTDGALPIEYSEVTITRRVFRSGDSEYYINRNACRLKDIVELFMDTGVGKEGYSIIGQGRIDEILSTRSEDRRYIFEEAAGIVKYKSRRDEAEKKLSKTQDNLLRVNDILTELEQQLTPLEEQANTAKVYLKLKEELKYLEINQFIHQFNKHTTKIEELKVQIEALETDISTHKDLSVKREEEKVLLSAELAGLNAFVEEMKKERYELLNSAERLKGELSVYGEKIKQYERDNTRLLQEIQDEQREKEIKNASSNTLNQSLLECQVELDKSRLSAEDVSSKLLVIDQDVNRYQTMMDETKGNIIEVLNKISGCKNELTRYHTIETNFDGRLLKIAEALSDKGEEESQLLETKAIVSSDIKALVKDSEVLKGKRLLNEQEVRQQKQQLVEMEAGLQKNRQQLEGSKSRLRLLNDMKKGYEGFQKSVKEVLLACKNNNETAHNVCGAVAELIRVPKEYELALETALGPSMQHIVTEQEEEAKKLIEFLKRNNYGRATFLPISSIKGRSINGAERDVLKMNGCIGVASSLVDCDPKYRGIIENLLGRVVIAQNLDTAILMARRYSYSFRIVTLEGDVLNPGGSMTGGSRAHKGISILSRNREIKELGMAVDRLNEQLLDGQERMDTLAVDYRAGKQLLEDMDRELKALEIKKAALDEKFSRLSLQMEQVLKESTFLVNERDQINENLVELKASIQENEELLIKFESQSSHINLSAQESEQALREKLREKEKLNSLASDIRIEIASLDTKRRAGSDEIAKLQGEISRHDGNIATKEMQIKENSKEAETLDTTHHSTLANIKGIEDKVEEHRLKISQAEDRRRTCEDTMSEIEKGIKGINQTISELTDRKYRFEVQLSRLDVEIENYQNNVWEEYGITYAGALEYQDASLTITSINQNVLRVKGDISALGEVNVNSIEEHKRINERWIFLTEQKDDLITAREDLRGIIQDITKTMEERFKQEFDIINEYFNETFRELFSGGNAQLVLEDKSDVLSCGIDIIAQPPGKKLQSLSLLSGGERALTAIGILFAILKHKPTPFCVLDEIDAALDESNVAHFSRFIKSFSDDTQFVIITHRKGTMEVCDVLYGVAMEEKGVSKLISVRFEEKAG